MQDRVSLYPGRVTLTPVAGQENTYDMKRADQPTQEGDPLNKDTLLKDATAALFGLGNTAFPDDVLKKISELLTASGSEIGKRLVMETGSYAGTGTTGSSNPTKIFYTMKNPLFFLVGRMYSEFDYSITDTDWFLKFISSFPYGESYGGSGQSGGRCVFSQNVSKQSVSFYNIANNANEQMNTKGSNYFYAFFGLEE